MNNLLRIVAILIGLLPLQSGAKREAWTWPWRRNGQQPRSSNITWKACTRRGWPSCTGDYEAKADVTDRITVEFSWDTKTRKIIGPVTVKDGKSELSNIKSDGTNCPPPQLKGDYEHFQSVSNS